ncbi:MAG: lysine--tRNA ligase, partial [Dehalococcoidales bacterium]
MTSRLDRITQQRIDKAESLRNSGFDPYPNSYQRTHTALQAVKLLEAIEKGEVKEEKVSIAGRIMANRSMGKSSFIDIRDATGKIQLLFMNTNQMDEQKLKVFKNLDIGDFIGVEGTILRTRTGEPTIRVDNFTLLSKSLLPLPDKWHGLVDVETR